MRSLLPLLCAIAVLPAEEVQIFQGGGVEAATNLPGFIRIRVNDQPAASHLVRVGAISHLLVPRPDRPGDTVTIVVPLANDTLRFVVPTRFQAADEVQAAIAKAIALGNTTR